MLHKLEATATMEDSSVEKEIQSLVPMRDRLRVAFEATDDKTEKVSVEVF
jgi:hypothetical protein